MVPANRPRNRPRSRGNPCCPQVHVRQYRESRPRIRTRQRADLNRPPRAHHPRPLLRLAVERSPPDRRPSSFRHGRPRRPHLPHPRFPPSPSRMAGIPHLRPPRPNPRTASRLPCQNPERITMTPIPITPLPVCLAPERDVIPHAYVLHVRTCECKNCGETREYTELYIKTHLRTRTGAGRYVTNLRPCITPEFRLPIETVPIEKRVVPFCSVCVWDYERAGMLALPFPPKPETPHIVSVHQSSEDAKSSSSSKKKPAISAIDLMDTI